MIVPASPGDTSSSTTQVRSGAPRSEITVQMDYEPEGFKETVGSLADSDSRRVKGDLERFKNFIEARQGETGAWRGEVREGVAPERHL
jgi:hypothetical protein